MLYKELSAWLSGMHINNRDACYVKEEGFLFLEMLLPLMHQHMTGSKVINSIIIFKSQHPFKFVRRLIFKFIDLLF